MKILLLATDVARNLAEWLVLQHEDVIYTGKEITPRYVRSTRPQFIIIYNYPYIIKKEIIDLVNGNAVNLHISYLPWNRGSYPNIWSFLKGTPKGVSIIRIDKGVDTGGILEQKEIFFDEDKETLKSSYERLHKKIQELFKANWDRIKKGEISPRRQEGKGSFHFASEYETVIKPLIKEKGWDTPIKELKEKYEAIVL